jgi:hypothetical protein
MKAIFHGSTALSHTVLETSGILGQSSVLMACKVMQWVCRMEA